MDAWMWFALAVIVTAAIGLLIANAQEHAETRHGLNLAHEAALAQVEREMFTESLSKPPLSMFQKRGITMPDLLGRSRIAQNADGDVYELADAIEGLTTRIANVEVMLAGSEEKVAAYVERQEASPPQPDTGSKPEPQPDPFADDDAPEARA